MSEDPVRISPLNPAEFTAEQKEVVGNWGVLNFSRVLAHHPALYRVFVPFIEKVISFTDLPPWDREVLVIRTLYQCGETYEFGHHLDIAQHKVNMTDTQIESILTNGECLSDFDILLMQAADELIGDFHISDGTWEALAERYTTVQLMEVVGLVGCYTTMAMLTRSFGIQSESKEAVEKELAALRTYE